MSRQKNGDIISIKKFTKLAKMYNKNNTLRSLDDISKDKSYYEVVSDVDAVISLQFCTSNNAMANTIFDYFIDRGYVNNDCHEVFQDGRRMQFMGSNSISKSINVEIENKKGVYFEEEKFNFDIYIPRNIIQTLFDFIEMHRNYLVQQCSNYESILNIFILQVDNSVEGSILISEKGVSTERLIVKANYSSPRRMYISSKLIKLVADNDTQFNSLEGLIILEDY